MKNIQLIPAETYTKTNWSGGKTSELFIYPKEADFKQGNFSLRISIATVEVESSQFTSLPDVQRTLMVLEGTLKLEHDGQHSCELLPFEQDQFSGNWSTKSWGKVTDFNVMTKNETKTIVQKIDLIANYSFQHAVDRSQKNAPTYGHQIVYTPKHTGNFDLTLNRKKAGVRFSSSWVGSRYSLNENIQSNLLDPFVLIDLSLFQAFDLKIRNKINFQFQINNIV